MDDNPNPKQQLVERLKSANNILVTVSTNPSVDQLAACIGLTLWLNKLGKHATAVFSGEVPSTLGFLKPEDTLEKNTDSLRDFIISLDKSKADKLRYKVEDRVVKIFITPYRTSLSADDLEFSQGDFNVDAVVALGVKEQQDLDNAITGHGRILHDATVMTVNIGGTGGLGSMNWHDPSASSLSELAVDLGRELGRDQLDGQIATALLTGIVAETERFSNSKTTPQTMSVSAELMSAGANQQLVASKLEGTSVPLRDGPATQDHSSKSQGVASDDGTLEIGHHGSSKPKKSKDSNAAEQPEEHDEPEPAKNEPDIDQADDTETHLANTGKASKLVTEPPTLGGTLTANTSPDRPEQEPSTDPLSLPKVEDSPPLLNHNEAPLNIAQEQPADPGAFSPPPAHWTPPAFLENASPASAEPPVSTSQPEPVSEVPAVPFVPSEQPSTSPPPSNETLTELEQSIDSPHAPDTANPDLDAAKLDSARSEVESALNSTPPPTPATDSVATQPTESATGPTQPSAPPSLEFDPAAFGITDTDAGQPTPQPLIIPGAKEQPSGVQPMQIPVDPSAAPPVPPPLPPSMYQADANSSQDQAA
jgi:hypothetical protein